MPLSIEGRPDAERATRTVHAALDAGVTLIDTADAYHLNAGEVGHNERLIAQALATYGGAPSAAHRAAQGGRLPRAAGAWRVRRAPHDLLLARAGPRTADGGARRGRSPDQRPA